MPDFHVQPNGKQFVNMLLFAAANPGGHDPLGNASRAFSKMMLDLLPDKKIGLEVYNPGARGSDPCGIPGLDETEITRLIDPFGAEPLTPDDCIEMVVDNTAFDQ
jgi:hypothetical protein